MRLLLLLSALLAGLAEPAFARPVSYPGGWTLMQMNDPFSSSLHIHYSPSATYSVGYKGDYFRDEDWQFHGLQLNNLLHRWNNPDSQANLYLKTALGIAYSDHARFDHRSEGAGLTGLAADWENRRFFTSYENRVLYAGDIAQEFTQKARVGIAPYIGDYGDLHTWLMLQVDHTPSAQDTFSVTPLVRLFKGPHLLEAGVNNHGGLLLNYVHRF